MDRDQARLHLRGKLEEYVQRITEKSKGHGMYICPLCGSGTGKNHTGAFSITGDGKSWKCFSCSKGGDIFDLIGEVEHIESYPDRLKKACEIFGVTLDGYTPTVKTTGKKALAVTPVKAEGEKGNTEEQVDLTAYIAEARKRIGSTDYPQRRGLSQRIIDAFSLGYDPQWTHPNSKHGIPDERLIIPISKYGYAARAIGESRSPKMKVGNTSLFNAKVLTETEEPVFIVEGEFDAMSIEEVGGHAVALCGKGNYRSLQPHLKGLKKSPPFIIAMDNDEEGKKAIPNISKVLEEAGADFTVFNPGWKYKDANEALLANRESFRRELEKACDFAMQRRSEEEAKKAGEVERQRAEYRATSTANFIEGFRDGIKDSVNTPSIPTGFPCLDRILDGGLYEGLYSVGAISSLGKTAFVMQMADQIAKGSRYPLEDGRDVEGHDVLIFSLEMARTELMARSISRATLQLVTKFHASMTIPKTTRGILIGKRYEKYSDEEKMYINLAISEYSEIAERIYIKEGLGDIGVRQIREAVDRHIRFTGKPPVVVVDYLQILAPYNERYSDKQNTDKAVLELKRISRDYKIPVIAISSFNRSSYKETAGMEAFKESGAIEYSADVLIALQLTGTGTEGFDVNKAKKASPRLIDLVILKNRNGATGDKIPLKFYPLFNFFKEVEDDDMKKALKDFKY